MKREKIILVGTILSCFGIAWLVQSSLIYNSDVSWLMLATKRWLTGGNYTHDFFEINPPMVLYLYTPAVYLVKIFNLPVYLGLRIYVLLLIAITLFFCGKLTKKIFIADNTMLRNNFLLALTAILLFLPMTEFGQREHLVVIFTLPYFLLIVLRLQNHDKIQWAFVIGLFAGLGFMIKPYFLAPFLAAEIFYYCKNKSLKIWRPETAAIALVFLTVLALILLFNRDYITTIMPITTHFYYQKYGLPVTVMLLDEQAVLAYFALLFYVLRYRFHAYQMLSTVLMLCVCGFLFVYIIQQTPWYYHKLPLLMTSTLLFALLFSQLITQKKISRAEYYTLFLFGLALLAYLCLHMSYISISLAYFPVAFFSLFLVLCAVLFSAAGARLLTIIFFTMLMLASSIAFYRYLLHSPLQTHSFMLTSILLILLFGLFIPKKLTADKLRFIQFMVLGSLIFAGAFYQGGYVYFYAQDYKKLYGKLLAMLRDYPNQSVFFFSNIADFGFPALDYTQQTLASRFAGLGWSPPLPYRADAQSYANAYRKNFAMDDFFVNAVVEDFDKYQPDVVFVDLRNTDADGVKRYFGNEQMDYIKFFSVNTAFKNTWRHYHYLKTVDGQPLFKFNIYLRYPSV